MYVTSLAQQLYCQEVGMETLERDQGFVLFEETGVSILFPTHGKPPHDRRLGSIPYLGHGYKLVRRGT